MENKSETGQGQFLQKLPSALIIKQQVEKLLEDSSHGEAYKKNVRVAVDDSLHHMLNAVDQQTYSLYAGRLLSMTQQVSKHEIPKESADKYQLLRRIHRALDESTFNNKIQIEDKIPDFCKAHLDYKSWNERIKGLMKASFEADFNSLKSSLMDSLVNEEGQDVKSHAMSVIEQNISKLGAARQSSLKNSNDQSGRVKSLAWIGLGSLLVTAAAVISLAFPPLIIPGLAIAGAVVIYGVTDLAKKGRALKKQLIAGCLADRGVNEKTNESIRDFEKQPHEHPHLLGNKGDQMKEGQAKENKKIKQYAFGLSSVSLMVGIAAVAVALPMVAAPIGAVIALVALSSALVVFTGVLFGYKRYKDKKNTKEVQSEVARKIENDDKIFSDLGIKPNNSLDSTAMIMEEGGVPRDAGFQDKVSPSVVNQGPQVLPSIKRLEPTDERPPDESDDESDDEGGETSGPHL